MTVQANAKIMPSGLRQSPLEFPTLRKSKPSPSR